MAKDNFLMKDYYNYITSSIDLLYELANKGDDAAQYVLGVLLIRETPITKYSINNKSFKTAITMLTRSAKAYNIDAMLKLIHVYKQVISVLDNKGDIESYEKKIYELKETLNNHIKFINKQIEDIENGKDPFSTRFPKPKTENEIELILDNDLNTFTSNLNQLCIRLNNSDKEVVSEETMFKAKHVVDNLIPENYKEVMLYCASLNVLNTFVKQKQKQITYYFKTKVVDVLIKSIIENDIEGVTYYISDDCHMTIGYIKVSNIIFSFHQVTIDELSKEMIYNSNKNQLIIFDDVRKQKCSVSIFYNILNFIGRITDLED